jgi:hypothetical protein
VGSARVAQEAQDRAQHVIRNDEIERQQVDLERKHSALVGEIEGLRKEFSAEAARIGRIIKQDRLREQALVHDEVEMSESREHAGVAVPRSLVPSNGNGNGNGSK